MQEKKFLSFHELIAVGSLLFGMLFGAGNLIFPPYPWAKRRSLVCSCGSGFSGHSGRAARSGHYQLCSLP